MSCPVAGLFVPEAFAIDPATCRDWIGRAPLAQVVTLGAGGLAASAVPLVFASDAPAAEELVGHVAARNGQAAELQGPALALFRGPDAYVSPRWFRERADLPTWNYVVVQVRGTLLPVDAAEGKLAILTRTAEVLERGRPAPWSMAEADPARVAQLLPHIRAFRLRIAAIEGAMRLNQNRPETEHANLTAGLAASHDPGAPGVAALMPTVASRV
jgi:transcriptional regulator